MYPAPDLAFTSCRDILRTNGELSNFRKRNEKGETPQCRTSLAPRVTHPRSKQLQCASGTKVGFSVKYSLKSVVELIAILGVA